MIREVWGLKCRGAGPLISLPEYVPCFRAMEPSSSSELGSVLGPHHAQQVQQQGNHRANVGSINSTVAVAKPRKGSFGGVGSAVQQQGNHRANLGSINSIVAVAKPSKGSFGGAGQNSSSQFRISSPAVPIQFGTVGVSDGTPSYTQKSLSNDFPKLAIVGKAPASTLQTVTASLDGEQLGNGSKLESNASPLPVEGTSANVQDIKSQVTPKRPSGHRPWGPGEANKDSVPATPSPSISRHRPWGPGEANKDSVPATPSPSIDDIQFPPLNATSAAGNWESSRKAKGRATAEQVQTHLPLVPQELKQAGAVDSPTSLQAVAERERQRTINQNRQSVSYDRRKAGYRKDAELRNELEIGDWRDRRQNRPGRDPAWEKAQSIDTLGRALTRLLRHKAVEMNLKMSSDGYVDVQDILKLSMKTASNRPLTSHSIADVKQVVQQDKKQRFGIKDENGRLFIRANQGHTLESVKSEQLLKPIVSADEVPVCVHGTYYRHLDLIFKEGLKRMQRNHIHFASGVSGSENVISGMRSTCEVLIYLNVKKALADGMKLYISENKVILTDGFEGVVPPEYFKEVLGLPDMKPIAPPSGPA